MRKQILFLLGLLIMLTACEPIDPVAYAFEQLGLRQKGKPTVQTDTPSLRLSDEAGTSSITMTVNGQWTVDVVCSNPSSSTDRWLTVTPTEGKSGNYKLTVKSEENSSYDERTASIIINVKSGKQTISDTIAVSQVPKGAVMLERDTFEDLPFEGAEIEVVAQTNVKIDAEIPFGVDWVEKVETKGLSTEYISLRVLPNPLGEPRSATILIINEETGIRKNLTISQKAMPQDMFYFVALEPGASVGFYKEGEPLVNTLQVSRDGANWESVSAEMKSFNFELVGERLYVRAKEAGQFSADGDNYFAFSPVKAAVCGNVMYLLEPYGNPRELNENEFFGLFRRSGLIDAKDLILPTDTLSKGCYAEMFNGCTDLAAAPELPATGLAERCYQSMFKGCTSLTKAPELPVIDLAKECYREMFKDCAGLTSAPQLASTSLAEGCYLGMFSGCTSLTEAPDLLAETLLKECYKEMFKGSKMLSSIKVGFASWNEAGNSTTDWLKDVSPTGTFKSLNTLDLKHGDSFIPDGWSASYPQQVEDCFCFTALEDGASVEIKRRGDPYVKRLLISTDGEQWTEVPADNQAFDLPKTGDKLYVRAAEKGRFNKFGNEYVSFGPAKAKVGGNIMYLIDPDGKSTKLNESYDFVSLFEYSGLVDASELKLPATTLSRRCYSGMFHGCESLKNVPVLPATTLAADCYFTMFSGCTSLTAAPELPVTTLADYCYCSMFSDCTALTVAPELPATTLAMGCYGSMFSGCTSLTAAPELPVTTLADYCYSSMFRACSSLKEAPVLPATTLAERCYENMFEYCTALTVAPDLPAETLANSCYIGMFRGCSSLNSIKVGFTSWNGEGQSTTEWMVDVASTGSFEYNPLLPIERNESRIPWGWNPFHKMQVEDCFCFTALEDGASVEIKRSGYSNVKRLYISTDGEQWTEVPADNQTFDLPKAGDKLYVRAAEKGGFNDTDNYISFNPVKAKVSGNIMYLVDPKGETKTLNEGDFFGLFKKSEIVDASELKLPATTLADACYYEMFSECKSLKKAPALPDAELAANCYCSMFKDCSSLTAAPELPATTLANACYREMFVRCTSLTAAPELPATILAESCYRGMFDGCTSLTAAPDLMATNLVDGCYKYMFYDCSNLNSIKVGFTSWNEAGESTEGWVYDVASTGTFKHTPSLEIKYGDWFVPDGWNTSYPQKVEDCFCFTALENGASVEIKRSGEPHVKRLLISTDGEQWTEVPADNQTFDLPKAGDKLYIRAAEKGEFNDTDNYISFNPVKAKVGGNIMYLVDPKGETETLNDGAFFGLFMESGLVDASGLKLPATTLAYACYVGMFIECTSLTAAPALPATALAESCYEMMFSGCTSLTAAPALPAIDLARSCYGSMFSGCTSLTAAPALPATDLAESCYEMMFSGCTSLTAAPALPATTLDTECYTCMFEMCTSLKEAPSLGATTLAEGCYEMMFSECSSLTAAPALPATDLAERCYGSMFLGCTSLKEAPALDAAILAESCYERMFVGCTSLTAAPDLMATNLVDGCYKEMFNGCSKLNSIKVGFTSWNEAGESTGYWVKDVASTGTFEQTSSLEIKIGNSFIPYDWTISQKVADCFCFTALEDGASVEIKKAGNPFVKHLLISTDGEHWTKIPAENKLFDLPKTGDKLYVRAAVKGRFNNNSYNYISFNPVKAKVSGNIMYLVDPKGEATTMNDSDFCGLFANSGLVDASELKLPATSLSNYCYEAMFKECKSLKNAPVLPATNLASRCYSSMFYGCIALTAAPALPATALESHCYEGMFFGCSALTAAPTLPATSLNTGCYSNMFSGCSALTAAPALPATTLEWGCYVAMFSDCTSLTAAPALPAATLVEYCYRNMFSGCTSLKATPELPATTLAEGCYRSMFEGCISLTSARHLLAETLEKECYMEMFKGCSNLKSIIVGFRSWKDGSTFNWVKDVASTGIFVSVYRIDEIYGDSNIPTDWSADLPPVVGAD